MVIWHLEEIGKVKKLNKWVPHELTANQKIVVLKCLFSYCMQQWTISQSDCGVQNKWIVHNNQQCPAQWLDWEEAPKHFPKPNLHPPPKKKVMVTAWWSAAHLIHYSSLNPGKTIISEKYAQQIDVISRKLPHLQPALANRKGLILLHDNVQLHIAQPTLQKLNEKGYRSFASSVIFISPLASNYHFFHISTTFCRGNTSTTSRRQKILTKSSLNTEAQIFMLKK